MSTGPRFYVIRQARTKVIGSRTMTRDEAAWRDQIGPAAIVPASAEARKAVRTENQAELAKLLEWERS